MVINELFNRASGGNKSAQDELFKKLTDRFWVFAHRKVWNKEEAEEIVQNALATVMSEYRKTNLSANFAGWAHKVIENKFLAYIQTRRRQGGRIARQGLLLVVMSTGKKSGNTLRIHFWQPFCCRTVPLQPMGHHGKKFILCMFFDFRLMTASRKLMILQMGHVLPQRVPDHPSRMGILCAMQHYRRSLN